MVREPAAKIKAVDPSPTREHRSVWQRKPVLRRIYADWYRRIQAWCSDGKTLEIGGGSGNFRAQHHDVVSIDVQPLPWLDAVADAHALPFADGAFANIVLVDVLHHLARPDTFFEEAARVLRPGGRVIMVEPAITPVSRLAFTWLHPEPVDLTPDPLAGAPLSTDEPFSSNQAIPTLIFERHPERFARRFPNLEVLCCERFGPFSYPLSGGFRPWSLLPSGLAGPLLQAEAALEHVVAPLVAFRLLVVVERRPVRS